jgi:hypothetical protein
MRAGMESRCNEINPKNAEQHSQNQDKRSAQFHLDVIQAIVGAQLKRVKPSENRVAGFLFRVIFEHPTGYCFALCNYCYTDQCLNTGADGK